MTTMSETMLKLGRFPFALNSTAYDQLRQVWRFNWRHSQRASGYPQPQFTGQGPRDITVSGVIYPAEFGTPDQLQAMAAAAASGEPLLLVSGVGEVLGYWAITSIERGDRDLFADGVARRVEFSVALTYYGANHER